MTGIRIDDQREAEMQACFSNKVEFHHASELDELTELTKKFKLRTRDIVNNESNSGFGEKNFSGSFYCYGRRFRYS